MNPPQMPQMPPSYQEMQDAEHMRLLSIFHYIYGGLCFFGCLFGLLYIGMGAVFSGVFKELGTKGAGSAPPAEIGWVFVAIGSAVMLFSGALGTSHILSARWMKARRNRTFCMVVAGISCISFPFGTAIGVFTLIVLGRPSVAIQFNQNQPLTTPNA